MLGKTKFEELLSDLIEKQQGKPTLVPMSDKRPALSTLSATALSFTYLRLERPSTNFQSFHSLPLKKIEAAIQAAYEEGESKLKGNGKSVPSLRC